MLVVRTCCNAVWPGSYCRSKTIVEVRASVLEETEQSYRLKSREVGMGDAFQGENRVRYSVKWVRFVRLIDRDSYGRRATSSLRLMSCER